MFHQARDHVSVNAAAKALGTYRLNLLALCEVNGVPVVPLNGVLFLASASIGRVSELLAAWRDRPRLKIATLRRRPKRMYAPWRPRAGDDAANLARTKRVDAQLDLYLLRREAKRQVRRQAREAEYDQQTAT